MRYVMAVYFWTMVVLTTLVLFVACAVRHAWVVISRAPRDGRPVHAVAAVWGRFLVRCMPGWRVTVEGRENLPKESDPPVVVVANHESMADIWAMYFLYLQFRWLSKIEVFKIPLVGHAMRWARYVPVERGRRESHAKAMADSAERLRQGLSMLFFPEGTRSKDGTIKPFKMGAFKLAQEAQVRVLPVALHGAGGLLRKGSAVPAASAHVQLKVLPPLDPPPPGTDLASYAARVRDLIIEAHRSLV